jgi:hypothetical protein
MCALALHHLKLCLDSILRRNAPLLSGDRELIAEYLTAYRDSNVKELRDALEHEEERFSGDGRGHRDKVYEGDNDGAPVIMSRADRLDSIYVLGQRYRISEVVRTAIALNRPLLDLTDATLLHKASS